ncbi:hypothetical protein [Gordonia humi]|uniref:Uncharacterized protein n=1 Tax=Gordonia humi TaxID=686429 RepID=A0A840ESR7_9ACTN|nr:hypothetical protein [Gordonia humi]MBB4134732.1 hypothetical protein [Gordonia humi]
MTVSTFDLDRQTEPLVLTCEKCDTSVQLLGDQTAVDTDMIKADWEAEHRHCGDSPELKHWDAMSQAIPHTQFGLEQQIGPRPSWSDPSNDKVGGLIPSYGSSTARTHLSLHNGLPTGDTYTPAYVSVCARLRSTVNGGPVVGMTTHKYYDGEWLRRGTALTPDEARHHAALLVAAADLAESEIGGSC